MKIEWSRYQKAIFKAIGDGKEHVFVSARAGSSKTTSLVEAVKHIPRGNTILVVAFNKIIAKELSERLGSYVEIYTLHSLGYAAVRKRFPDIKLDFNKSFKIIQSELPSDLKGRNNIAFTLETCRALSLAKSYLIDTPSKIDELLDQFNISSPLPRSEYIAFIIKCLKICKEQTETLDYDDMIYFPFVFNLDVGKRDRVIVDEAQDLTMPQLHMAYSACKPGGKLSVFYDSFQEIYSWRGSNVKALELLKKKLDATSLLLPISYRCDKSIVRLAQDVVPDIQHRPNANEGWVIDYPEVNLFKAVKPGDFVISRTNAPLFKYALYCMRHNIPAHLQGKSMSAPLVAIINKSKKKKIKDFLIWLEDYEKEEVKRLKSKNRPTENFVDTIESLRYLSEDSSSIDELKKIIAQICDSKKDNEQITFSTVHAAKGLERRRVFLIMRTFKIGKSQEENNIYYVGLTRAREELYLLK